MIERDFDIPFVADLALREKQIQQNYRPVICVHKWFARRPGTLFRSLLLAEFAAGPLAEAYYASHDLPHVRIADPFMGGGTPVLEANRIGCQVVGYDINPMAYWIVRQEIEHIDINQYRAAAGQLIAGLEDRIGRLYATTCLHCGKTVPVKYFLWVKTQPCADCGKDLDLFPGFVVAKNQRHPRYVLVCPGCGQLQEAERLDAPGRCSACGERLAVEGPAARGTAACAQCGRTNRYPAEHRSVPRHRLFALEYHCPHCAAAHEGRFFKTPDADDLRRAADAATMLAQIGTRFVPDDEIPAGEETTRLHRWGYRQYREMFNARQLLSLELSCRAIAEVADERISGALATNLSDLLRYQNMLCRYDTYALKSLDVFSVHGFPVGLVQCESNALGVEDQRRRGCVGSGGWRNIADKYAKAKEYCDRPYEVRCRNGRKNVVPIEGEWIGDRRNGQRGSRKVVRLLCSDASREQLEPQSLDGVFTDPPYYGNVQYAELMDFCYVWLRRLLAGKVDAFAARSTRNDGELTVNASAGRGEEHFAEGMSRVFRHMAEALRPGAPLVFTYHHNELRAYYPLAVAVLDAGLTCSASLPCPAEMGASIHISGTGSSIVDTVFVCRHSGVTRRKWLTSSPQKLAELVAHDASMLTLGRVKPSVGDIRCMAYGHLVRLAIWSLRSDWRSDAPVAARIREVADWVEGFMDGAALDACLARAVAECGMAQPARVREAVSEYGGGNGEVPF